MQLTKCISYHDMLMMSLSTKDLVMFSPQLYPGIQLHIE